MRRSGPFTPRPRYSPSRKRRAERTPRLLLVLVGVAGLSWVYWLRNAENAGRSGAERRVDSRAQTAAVPADNRYPALSDPNANIDWTGGLASAAADGASPAELPGTDRAGLLLALAPQEAATRAAAGDSGLRENPDIAASRKLIAAGQVIEARHQLNAFLVRSDLTPAELADVRDLLATLANDTLFSNRRVPDDPLIDTYTIKSGDRLIHIAKQYDTPFEILMEINGIRDAGRIRENQKLKVLRGPFHARIHKSQCRMDLYLQDLYVRSYRVAVGAADKITPEGVWRVAEKLPNPTYHPPPTAEIREIIAANDPRNPLGEHWIGLEGVEGDAVGRSGFGIHGTIEPDSIGKAVSDGCIRMHNEEVAFVYALLVPGKSLVTVLP